MFRSAAYSYGPGAVGVILSGALNDGTSGLWTIKRLGGTAIVQDPYEAQYPSMPRSALEYVDADYRVRATEISAILARLASELSSQEKAEHAVEPGLEARIAKEVQIAAGRDISYKSIIELGELTPFTCTECHGALIRIVEDKLSRYRCHTGHGYTEETLLESVIQSTGEYIWQTTRGLQEAEMLVEHIGRHMLETGDTSRAQKFMSMARELGRRANRFHELATDHDNLSGGRLEEEQE